MTPEYLAGLFDGEGNIRIQAYNGGTCFKVRCVLVNTHLPVIRSVIESFGGKFEVRAAREKSNQRQSFGVRWDGTYNVKRFLEAIRPFSIIKRDEIAIVLDEFIPSMDSKKRRALPPYVLASRRDMRERLSALKRVEWPFDRKAS